MDKLLLKHDVTIIVDSEFKMSDCTCNKTTCICLKYAVPLECVFSKAGLNSMSFLENIKQRKGEAEMAQADWLLQSANNLKPGDAVASVVTSGDIDAVIIHMYTVSRHWQRNKDNTFRNPVYVLLQKPSGTDVYNITRIIEVLEHTHKDVHISEKIALTLCIAGNDFIPKMHQINHTRVLRHLLENKEFCDSMFKFEQSMILDSNMYIEFVKQLYCRKRLGDPKLVSFEEVRKDTMVLKKKAAQGDLMLQTTANPRKWLPPQTALSRMAELINLQIQYLDSAGTASAALPDFLAADCLQKSKTGEIEYNFGSDSFLSNTELSSLIPRTPVKTGKKRLAEGTPQKGRRRKIPLKSSTPVKQ